MKILSLRRYDNLSLHADRPVFMVLLDMDKDSGTLAAGDSGRFLDDVRHLLPADIFGQMIALKAWPEQIEKGKETEFLAHIFCQLSLALQHLDGTGCRPYYHFRPQENSKWSLCIAFHDWVNANNAIGVSARILSLLINGLDEARRETAHENLEKLLRQFQAYSDRYSLGPLTQSYVVEAQRRDIPWRRASGKENFTIFGQGHLQKQMLVSSSSDGSMTATAIAKNKNVANQMMGEVGLPVPRQHMVHTSELAEQALKMVGAPVVVKPAATDQGVGISVNVTTVDEVKTAIDKALEYCPQVIVEKYLEGDDHRILVVGGKFIAAARRIPAMVTGDGKRTIEQLVAEANKDPRRGLDHEKVMSIIRLDAESDRVVGEQGFEMASILEKGKQVYLKGTANLSTGGTAVDVTDIIHPDNIRMAERAVKLIGLNISGVDFITTDISQSYKTNGGGICEINHSPGLRPHWLANPDRDVVRPIMEDVIPPGTNARIPLAAITGSNGKTTTGWMLERIFSTMGKVVGLANTDGVKIGGDQIIHQDLSGKIGAEMILRDRTTEVAIAEVARQGLLKWGLGFDKCNVGAILNIDNEHLGSFGIESKEQLADLKGLLAEVTQDLLVLNAEDPLCLAQQSRSPARRICYVSMDPDNRALQEHVGQNGVAVTLTKQEDGDGEMITILDGDRSLFVMDPARIPATLSGRARFNVQNSLFAVAMAYGMGVSVEHIARGLESFSCNRSDTPGRQNIFENLPFTAISDYAHNPTKLSALLSILEVFDTKGKRILAFSSPGSRRDTQIAELATIAAQADFDHYICFRKDKLHDRKPDEVPLLLQKTLVEQGVEKTRISVIIDEQEAVRQGAKMAKADDLLVLAYTEYMRTEEILTNLD